MASPATVVAPARTYSFWSAFLPRLASTLAAGSIFYVAVTRKQQDSEQQFTQIRLETKGAADCAAYVNKIYEIHEGGKRSADTIALFGESIIGQPVVVKKGVNASERFRRNALAIGHGYSEIRFSFHKHMVDIFARIAHPTSGHRPAPPAWENLHANRAMLDDVEDCRRDILHRYNQMIITMDLAEKEQSLMDNSSSDGLIATAKIAVHTSMQARALLYCAFPMTVAENRANPNGSPIDDSGTEFKVFNECATRWRENAFPANNMFYVPTSEDLLWVATEVRLRPPSLLRAHEESRKEVEEESSNAQEESSDAQEESSGQSTRD